MGFELDIFDDIGISADYLDWLVEERSINTQRHFEKFWEYYSNPMREVFSEVALGQKVKKTGRCYIQAQEYGLPARITGFTNSAGRGVFGGEPVKDIQRKEVVIENDIAWRINASTDFLFGKPISFVSKSPDSQKRSEIESILKAVFSANDGLGFFQDMAVLGSVYGFVDCLVRPGEALTQSISSGTRFANNLRDGSSSFLKISSLKDVLETARTIELELIEAPRALPVLEENDYKKINCYVQHFYQKKNFVKRRNSFISRLLSRNNGFLDNRDIVSVTEVVSSNAWQRYENKKLVFESELPLGFLPVVHIQNIAQPYYYEGLSDVESLMPLQDELNTRLSDRANRITFQSFKMYLGKGIEGFEGRPVSPGQMWFTDNPEATIEEFGGDAAVPSEDSHIAEIREAMDKISGVTPLVGGILKGKVGNLTSGVALRLTLMGMLSKTERKRFTYGEGLKKICGMVLEILDKAGVYESEISDRGIEIIFPSPLPENMTEKLKEAQMKKELGVSTEQVLRELGYEAKKGF